MAGRKVAVGFRSATAIAGVGELERTAREARARSRRRQCRSRRPARRAAPAGRASCRPAPGASPRDSAAAAAAALAGLPRRGRAAGRRRAQATRRAPRRGRESAGSGRRLGSRVGLQPQRVYPVDDPSHRRQRRRGDVWVSSAPGRLGAGERDRGLGVRPGRPGAAGKRAQAGISRSAPAHQTPEHRPQVVPLRVDEPREQPTDRGARPGRPQRVGDQPDCRPDRGVDPAIERDRRRCRERPRAAGTRSPPSARRRRPRSSRGKTAKV